MLNKEELIQFLKDNLIIELDTKYNYPKQFGYGTQNVLQIKLKIDDEIISKDHISLKSLKEELEDENYK